MCGIVGAIAERNVVPILMAGLAKLEYRGYDSAGISVIKDEQLKLLRAAGKVKVLQEAVNNKQLTGNIGIAHTRWATHGKPVTKNAHPHIIEDRIAIVHNGIIENYIQLKNELINEHSIELASDTDSEVIAAFIYLELQNKDIDLLDAVQIVLKKLEGAYGICVIDKLNNNKMVVARCGSPLVIGLGIGENFVASDILALQKVVTEFIYLEEGDCAEVFADKINIYDFAGNKVKRDIQDKDLHYEASDKGEYRHYMQKEIYEQERAVKATVSGRISDLHILEKSFGLKASEIFDKTKFIQIVACGTSYYAGLVARNWLEDIAGIPCNVEIASEFRYRNRSPIPGTLFVTLSQSGETADTLAALNSVINSECNNYSGSLSICNVPESSIVRASDLVFLTHAGPEIGVASTKAFVTQLTALLMLTLTLGRRAGLTDDKANKYTKQLLELPNLVESYLKIDKTINKVAKQFENKKSALFLGRGNHYPIALEGALKLKEISYIHAEAYPAGELKHGPLALVDKDMIVVVLAPNNNLLGKLKSNMQEVLARGGQLIVITEKKAKIKKEDNITIIEVPEVNDLLSPILYTIPLQLLAYDVAILKGTDVDQPRNLAKAVTVE